MSNNRASTNSNFAVRTFTSDPKETDTDDDGVPDSEEYDSLFTDPRDDRTYGLTRRHELALEDFFESSAYTDAEIKRVAQKMGIPEVSPGRRVDVQLTDATDDFDFVWQPRQSGIEKFVFTGLSGTERTDTWAANTAELDWGTDPWHPDSDNDGLTDGQEQLGLVTYLGASAFGIGPLERRALGTEPDDPDSDGDGYWDGWIGVHGVTYHDAGFGLDNADNLVLYREHLQMTEQTPGDTLPGKHQVDEQLQRSAV